MALHFTDLNLFKALVTSTGTYTEGSVHKCTPKPTVLTTGGNLIAVLSPTPGATIEVIPKNGDALRRMEISTPYAPAAMPTRKELCDPTQTQPCFMTMKLNGNTVYGWIDNITSKVHNASQYSYVIDWHVDWWLTAGDLASYGSGRLLRGPEAYARPDPSEPRKWIYNSTRTSINLADSYKCCIVCYAENGSAVPGTNPTIYYTTLKAAFWFPGHLIQPNSRATPSLSDIYSGKIEEILGINPESVVGCWIAPCPPVAPNETLVRHNSDSTLFFYVTDLGGTPYVSTKTLGRSLTADDNERFLIMEPNGSVIGQLPWGYEISEIKTCLDIGSGDARFLLRFVSGTAEEDAAAGLIASLPLITVPITSNATSSYVYSGEREYDITQKTIQRNQSAVSGIAGAGQSAVMGALTGAMTGAAGGPIGAGAGAALGFGLSLAGTGITYGTQGIFDRKNQEAVDKLKSNQAANIIISAGGLAWNSGILSGNWTICPMTRDSVSSAELLAKQSELGYITDIIVPNATTIINGKGPLQIQDLQVSGLNPEGNRYISAMFARGVHLD